MSIYMTLGVIVALLLIAAVAILLDFIRACERDRDVIQPPKRKPLKRRSRSFRARFGDFWLYWNAGMSIRAAWERAGRVL